MTQPQPRIGSLFSGFGGLDMAVEDLYGAVTAWHCQYEPPDKKGRPDVHQFAAQVLAHHWPGVPNLGDITAVDWDQVLADHGPVDILTGGFPCTDVSLAGKRAGLNDQTRSGLWAHMARAIHALNPNLVVIENVRGLLSAPADGDVEPCTWCLGDSDGEPVLRALGAVLGDLAGLGFDAEWVGLPASGVGAPHERFRVFVLAWPSRPEGPRLEVGRLRGRAGAGGLQAAADADHLGAHRGRARRAGRDEPAYHGVADADPGGGGQLPAEPDVQPGQSHVGGRTAPNAGHRPLTERARPTWRQGGERQPERGIAGTGGEGTHWGRFEPAIRRWERVTGQPAPGPVDDRGRLAAAFVEWMMGAPAGHFTDVPVPAMSDSQLRNAQLKAGGNGVVRQQAYAALDYLHHRATEAALSAA